MEEERKILVKHLLSKKQEVLNVGDETSSEMRNLCHCVSKFDKISKKALEKNSKLCSKKLFSNLIKAIQSDEKNILNDQEFAEVKEKILSLSKENEKILEQNANILQLLDEASYLEEEIVDIEKVNNLIQESLVKQKDTFKEIGHIE